MERAVALTRSDKILVGDLPTKIQEFRDSQTMLAGADATELVPLEEIERRYIEHVLRATDGNQTQAARILGVDRKTLHRKLKSSGA